MITRYKPGKPAAVDFVDQLPEGVQALLADVTSYPLQRLDLVEHQDQTLRGRSRAALPEDLAGNSMLRSDRCRPSPRQTA